MRTRAAWIRYSAPIGDDEVAFAASHYALAVLQPWEREVAARLKSAAPDMTVLMYKCLSSARTYEPGPVYTSGVCADEAEENGEHWFAHRPDGERVEWLGYPGHWQMAVWEPEYRQRWCDNVADELEDSAFDGIMADNDVFDDYYGVQPLADDRDLRDVRAGLDALVAEAGRRLNGMGRVLVPNIAESRREPGRWARHSRWGGGLEEVWLAWGPDAYLDPPTALRQVSEPPGPGVTVLRVATDGVAGHPNELYGLAASWVFREGRALLTATAPDGYVGTPWFPELGWDLGPALGAVRQKGNGFWREFRDGWAAVNLNEGRRRSVPFTAPAGFEDSSGCSPGRFRLEPHRGVVLRRPPGARSGSGTG